MSGDRPRVGISACLLGERVRFDAGHKRDAFLTDVLGRHVEWVEVCPEVEAGFGTPREPMRLVLAGAETRGRGEPFSPENLSLVVKEGDPVPGACIGINIQFYYQPNLQRPGQGGVSRAFPRYRADDQR